MSEAAEKEQTGGGQITVEELIRSQLRGKSTALERYDQILWKIRAGYLAVLYSLLTVLSGKDFELQDVLGDIAKIDVLFFTAISFSLCAFFIDVAFMLSRLRVIEARNELSDLALALARSESAAEKAPERLRRLLHLSGDGPSVPKFKVLINGTWPIILLYVTTPLTIAIFRTYVGQ